FSKSKGAFELLRGHADDRQRLPADLHRLSNHTGIAPKRSLPIGVSQHGIGIGIQLVGFNEATQGRFYSERGEVSGHSDAHEATVHAAVHNKSGSCNAPGERLGDLLDLLLNVLRVRIRERLKTLDAVLRHAKDDDLFWIRNR